MQQCVNPGWLTGREQLSRYTGISKRSLSRMMSEGLLPYKRLSHRLVIFRIRDVDRALENLTSLAR